ncbi:ABC transporter ATP-binding protein [Candidatus Fermentibacterales bacterium]|nr:ABC transporter ATP-binding protein [Candidatus Fermentibacterales bacterium]
MEETRVLAVEDVSKSYGRIDALCGISFWVEKGEIFGLVGPNGAGKTTTIEIIAGLRSPDSGSVSLLGLDPQRDEDRLRHHVGIQQQESELPERIRIREAMQLFSSFYGSTVDWRALLERMGLSDRLDSFFGELSGGQKRRLFISMALLSDPEVILLDELTSGLDPQGRRMLWDLVRDMRDSGKTVLLTTHYMDEAEHLCDRVGIIDRGRLAALGTPAALVAGMPGGTRVTVTPGRSLTNDVLDQLRGIEGVTGARLERDALVVGITSGRVLVDLVGLMSGLGLDLEDFDVERPTLEDVFLSVTGRELRD